jgi:hypothetical protein
MDSTEGIEDIAADLIARHCIGEITDQLIKSQMVSSLVAAVMSRDIKGAAAILETAAWRWASDSVAADELFYR